MDWYYAIGRTRYGPLEERQLRELFVSGRIGPGTLVWSPDLEDWTPLSDVAEFASLLAAGPEPPADEETATLASPDAAEDARPHPWSRWLARGYDSSIFSLAFGFVGIGALSLTVPAAAAWAAELPLLVYTVADVLVLIGLESFFLSVRGTTPGKWIFGIRVVPVSGGMPSFSVALRRTALVWWRGLGLGLPVVSLVTQIVAYSNLSREGRTSWDRDTGQVVVHRRMTIGRAVLALAAGVALFAILVAANMPVEPPTS
jgi:uncharacterized RDD family membrane protein YckC